MIVPLHPPLAPRNGHTLQILIASRVSSPGPGKQDIRSLDDQELLHRTWVGQHVSIPFELTFISGSGSGESLVRKEFKKLRRLVATNRYDLVLTEDMGRIVRRLEAHVFCEHCEDHDVRLISINDHIDTAVKGWRDASFFAAYRHEKSNEDTSERIKRTRASRFHYGECLELPIYGYVKPKGAESDGDVSKDPDAEKHYKEWFRLLDEEEATFQDVADYLNAEGAPTGKYCDTDVWTGTMVGRITRNTILKGLRQRNKRKSKRHNKSGKRKCVKATPEELRTREVPHLAFFSPEYYDRVVAKVKARNAKYKRKGENGLDTRAGVPKKRSRYPGQCVVCGVCGRKYVFGGHGQTDHLMCDGARGHVCWNGATVDGPLAAAKISAAVLREIEGLDGFDETYLAMLEEEARLAREACCDRLNSLQKELVQTEQELENVLKYIRTGIESMSLARDLHRLEEQKSSLSSQLVREKDQVADVIKLPSLDEMKERGRAWLTERAHDSYAFARALRRLTPRVVVFPHRLIDGGGIVLRARIRLQLASLVPDRFTRNVIRTSLVKEIVVDLFEPPQREAFRERIVAARAAHPLTGKRESERSVAAKLGLTITAAQRAAALQRLMDEQRLTDPYQPVTEPPEEGKLCRHKHPRYKFDPLPDAGAA